jgi:CRP-like cAMP-binding protein
MLVTKCRVARFKQGTTLIRQGDMSDTSMYLLKSGQVCAGAGAALLSWPVLRKQVCKLFRGTCPISTGGGTRRVQLVREGGRGGGTLRTLIGALGRCKFT